MARVCSWCGLPDPEWIEGLSPLGTALKPAHEPIILARKPLGEKTVAKNVLAHGTGALNINGTRVSTTESERSAMLKMSQGFVGRKWAEPHMANYGYEESMPEKTLSVPSASGRWPANIILTHSPGCKVSGERQDPGRTINRWDDGAKPFGGGAGHEYTGQQFSGEIVPTYDCEPGCPVAEMDDQSGERKAGGKVKGHEPSRTGQNGIYGHWDRVENKPHDDKGGASRFFQTFEGEGCVDGCPIAEMDEQSGDRPGMRDQRNVRPEEGEFFKQLQAGRVAADGETRQGFNDSGGASRFFQNFDAEQLVTEQRIAEDPGFLYTAKAAKSERNKGLDGKNHHPTVKPVKLMAYLCRLVTPPGGTVLDPFMGSGSTGVAAISEGFSFMGVEREPDYMPIAEARLLHAVKEAGLDVEIQAQVVEPPVSEPAVDEPAVGVDPEPIPEPDPEPSVAVSPGVLRNFD